VPKPAYELPSMEAVRQLPLNGLSMVSTFSGCGGSCLGFKRDGYKVLWANEFIEAARDVYSMNYPDVPLDSRDIRDVTAQDILTAVGKNQGELDVLEGSPPCASFSVAGVREAGWGLDRVYSESVQRTDDLFMEFVRLVQGIQPKVFQAENVSGLVRGTSKGYFFQILTALRQCGYRVNAKVLDASWLGVPQDRKRLIFIGVRNDLNKEPVFPTPLAHKYFVADACPYIAFVRRGAGKYHSARSYSSPTICASDAIRCETAIFSGGGWIAPIVGARRRWNISELKLISGFPDDFLLTGTFEQQWERIGRAVPPPMSYAIAKAIRTGVLQCQA
jgi:DNA (cytosine-5)-methyltransferase 1